MLPIKGKIRPLNDTVLVADMNFGEVITSSGIVIRSDDGKTEGIRPRWARVWAVGPTQKDVTVNEWVLVEHGRWSRGILVEENDAEITIRKIDTNSILIASNEPPSQN